MDLNQFAVYQLKNIPENRQIRFRSYKALQEKGIPVKHENYEQVYLGKMRSEETPENIREYLDRQLPKRFKGHSISVSDILVLNKSGVVTSYYVEKEGFTVITGFIRRASSGALVSFETKNFHIEGKEGSWVAFDSTMVDGKEFFLMEHETYGKEAAWVVVDETGKVVVDQVYHGFEPDVLQRIRDSFNPRQTE